MHAFEAPLRTMEVLRPVGESVALDRTYDRIDNDTTRGATQWKGTKDTSATAWQGLCLSTIFL